ncbi:MAG: SDR family NAD(P)-dependent oxidoreductase [Dehalococcoidia bacterium]|nr:SDR family NAD(P)-dependent oxidoreductase [Dehalococcoidia bacterium]MSQ34656.1 SDR family NAD(P)-dependent oxidoreductase [Dehalococcoidia bacterium]
MGKLEGKVAIVTGGGTGIGKETVRMMAAEGATVVIAGRRQQPLDEVVAGINASHGKVVARAVDLENGDAAAALGAWTLKQFGRVDIVVNNAGHSSNIRSIRWVGAEDWQSVFKVNVEGVYRLTQSVIEDMVKRGDGTIITVSSMAALAPGLLGGAHYSAAKAASLVLMREISTELRNRGIRACTIIPAEVDTPILNKRPLPPDEKARSTMMRPEDVAEAIMLCATMPSRTLVSEIVMMPTHQRDTSKDIEAARKAGAPPGAV